MSSLTRAVTDWTVQQSSGESRLVYPTNAYILVTKAEIEQSIPARFEQHVSKHPTRLAIKTGNQLLTYEELNRSSNRVALSILAQRPRGEEPIALLLEHGAPVIIALLGVLKAGKIYVPLDPAYPHERLTYMLEDAQAGLVVTDNRHLSLAKDMAQSARQVLNIDEIDANTHDENIGLTIPPDTLAYILYTSGSTGQPKGVVQNHRNVLHNIMKYTNGAHVCADDRISLLASFSFSAAVTNTFCALLNGASLFPYNIKEAGLADLATWLVREDITVYQSVPTVFRHFLDTLTGAEEFPRLRLIDLYGEAVSPNDVERYKRHFSQNCLLQHRMASTEMSVIRLYFLDKDTSISGSVVPVGYAVEDTEVLVLDDAGAEVGVNQIGEIAIKSCYLTPGYWRKPDLTQAAFLPASDGGNARVYHTGDLGCMLPDGRLLHLGRKDFRVKIRGHRVEVGEIEMALLELPAVREAVVAAREDTPGDQRLVAYIILAQGSALTVSDMRSFLKARLPDYMMPSAFVRLDALPLTPNNKVDRQALPAPERDRPDLATPFVASQDTLEHQLTEIWEELLGVQPIGVHDDFFELGGYSLLSVQLFAQIEKRTGKRLSLATLFQCPTIAHLANSLRHEGWGTSEALPVEIHRESAGSDSISHPLARYLPSRYHSALKRTYHRIQQSSSYLYLRSMYVRNGRKVARRFFSYALTQLQSKLQTMGLREGDTILMHSAFNFLNGFYGTPDQVIDGILNIIGNSGNLVMVSMSYTRSSYAYLKEGVPFDVNNTMSAMGIITEIFRRKQGVVRSANPAHPILAFGPAAQWIITDHDKTMYSCGKGSPFEKIVQLQAKALFFDVSLRSMTFFHYLEDLFQDTLPMKLYDDTPLEGIVIDASGNKKPVKTYVFSSEARRYRNSRDLQQALRKDNLIQTGKIGNTKLIVLDLKQVVGCAQTMVRAGKPLWHI